MIRHGCLAILAMLFLTACGQPVPPEKMAYVGLWRGKDMALLIDADGSVAYKRSEEGVSKSINGPLKAFEGDNVVVGVGPIATTFVVTVPPHQDTTGEDTVWKMTVDGVELTKVDTNL